MFNINDVFVQDLRD